LFVGLLGATALSISAANAAVLNLVVFDNGSLIGSATSSTGVINATFTDADFSEIHIQVTGVPIIPAPDFGTVTTDVSTATGFSGTHVITILAKQSGIGSILVNPGTVSFTANGLIGAPGPTTESFALNGTTVASHTFPASFGSDSASAATPGGLLSSETEGVAATFTAALQDQEATIEYAATGTVVPEPSTWAMMMLGGFAFLGFAGFRQMRQTSRGLV
jgi:hypothetical protein